MARALRAVLDHLGARTGPEDGAPVSAGCLDVPIPGAGFEGPGPHAVSGWVHDPGRVRGVVVSIDGQPVATAVRDIPRPDVVKALGLASSEILCGWAVTIEPGGAPGQEMEISAAAWSDDNRVRPIGVARVRLLERTPAPEGHLDLPAPGAVVTPGALWIRGWALFPGHLPASVELRLNGGSGRLARTRVSRADLGGRYPGLGDIAGFEEIVDISAMAPGEELTIDAIATSSDGRRLELPRVVCRVGEPGPGVSSGEAARAIVLRARTEHAASAPAARGGTRLVVFTHELGYGGGQLYLQELLRRWATEPGFSAAVVSPADGPLRQQLEAMGVPVHVCGGYPVDSVDAYEGRVRALVDWARPQGFNMVIANTMLAFIGADVGMRLGLPILWGIHESFELPVYWELASGGTAHPYVKSRAIQALHRADLVVFEATSTQLLYQEYVSHPVTLPYGVAIDDIATYVGATDRAAVRRDLGFAPDDLVILCVGTFEPRKSQAALAEAFHSVAHAHPAAHLVFIGDNGSASAQSLKNFATRSAVADRVRILPVVPQLFPWYLSADLLVSASDAESLPRSVLEVMAFGVPVLAAEVFGLPELIDDGVTGFLCPARDSAALASALDRVLSLQPSRLAAVGAAGAALVRDKHDSARCAAEYWRRIQELVELARATSAKVPAQQEA